MHSFLATNKKSTVNSHFCVVSNQKDAVRDHFTVVYIQNLTGNSQNPVINIQTRLVGEYLIEKTLGQVAVAANPAVSEKGPDAPHVFRSA